MTRTVPGAGHETVAAPRLTRIAGVTVFLGVLVQATLAGGFLAGRAGLLDVHMVVGAVMGIAAIALLIGGLIGRRSGREPGRVLALRALLLLVLLTTMLAGLAAGGTRDLLMLHIPAALILMGLANGLLRSTRPRGA